MNIQKTNVATRTIRFATIASAALIVSLPGVSHAAAMDAYFGFNFVGASHAEMELLSISYTQQINGPPQSKTLTFATPLVDGRGATAGGPTNLYNVGGDGATTRSNSELVNIFWSDFTGVPYPQIYVNSFTYTNNSGGGVETGTFGSGNAGYVVGLADDGTSTELLSTMAPEQSDIFLAAVNGTAGNAQGAYANLANPSLAGTVIFAASNTPIQSQVPVPAAVWLFGSALGLLGWMRRKA